MSWQWKSWSGQKNTGVSPTRKPAKVKFELYDYSVTDENGRSPFIELVEARDLSEARKITRERWNNTAGLYLAGDEERGFVNE